MRARQTARFTRISRLPCMGVSAQRRRTGIESRNDQRNDLWDHGVGLPVRFTSHRQSSARVGLIVRLGITLDQDGCATLTADTYSGTLATSLGSSPKDIWLEYCDYPTSHAAQAP